MKTLCLLLLLPIVVLCDGVAGPGPQPPPTTTPPPPPTTTIPVPTLPPSPNTSTTSPTTTTTSTTSVPTTTTTTSTTTVKPDTTTSTTTTTTTASTTTPTSTTTAGPNSTTIAPNTTTPAPAPTPTPTPEPAAGSWTVRDPTSNVICVKVNMAIRINVTYSKTDNKTGFAVLNVPKDANATGTCGNETQMLMLGWGNHNESYDNVLEMVFEKNATEKKFVVHNINLTLSVTPDEFPNSTQGITDFTLFNNHSWFATSLTRSYRCMKSQEVNLFTKNSTETMGMLTVSKVQLEAFHETNSTDFGAIEDCERSTDIVPITVGCALVGLVAVVLIGYLVGRRRSQARGYLSM